MIAIHTKSGAFSNEWVAYCEDNGVTYKQVDCFSSDIIRQLSGCKALLWHWPHHDYRAQLFARQLIASVEAMGLVVFPSAATCWHYDDKVGQKYLLEAIGAPLVPTHVFYDREKAMQWVEQATFPMVWKLRGGAGSQNVKLVKSRIAAQSIIQRSFGSGWKNSRLSPLRDRLWHFRRDKTLTSFMSIGKGAARAIFPHENDLRVTLQRDYVYFQDFIPNNDCDIRVLVIGERAIAIKRMVREGDFRASGSGAIVYDPAQIPQECLHLAFEVTSALKSQSCAFDFVRIKNKYAIVEISYAFSPAAYKVCDGYWDRSLVWHTAPVTPERFMIQDLLEVAQV